MFFHRRHRESHFPEPCSHSAAGTDLSQGFASVFVTAQDGLTLLVRRYGSGHACAHSIVCLPGLARTAADFHPLATALAADPAKPRLVLALESRSRTVSIRSQSQQLHYSSRTRRPLGSPGRARDHFGHICRHVFWWRTCHDAGGTAADCSRRRSPQRHRSRDGATGLDADQKFLDKGMLMPVQISSSYWYPLLARVRRNVFIQEPRRRAGSSGGKRPGANGARSTCRAAPSMISSLIASPVAGALSMPQTLWPVAT
jgi:hypothetical protein